MNCTASGVIVFYLTNNCWIDSFFHKKGTESACAAYVTSNSLIVFLVLIFDTLLCILSGCPFHLFVPLRLQKRPTRVTEYFFHNR